MPRKAQLTAFLTKLRPSGAARSIKDRHFRNGASPDVLSCSARLASRANAPRRSNSPFRELQVRIIRSAWGVRSKRWKHAASQTAQLSKLRHQASISAVVTRAGSAMKEIGRAH